MAQLSDMLIYLRKRKGLSQQELANILQISRSSIGMYETGKREPDLETLELFADFYNVDMNTLTGKSPISDNSIMKTKCINKRERNSDLAFLARKNKRSLQDEIDDRLYWSVENELDE